MKAPLIPDTLVVIPYTPIVIPDALVVIPDLIRDPEKGLNRSEGACLVPEDHRAPQLPPPGSRVKPGMTERWFGMAVRWLWMAVRWFGMAVRIDRKAPTRGAS